MGFAQNPRPVVVFFFNDTATTEIYTLSLHDALPISAGGRRGAGGGGASRRARPRGPRSEEHTSELQSRGHLVCRLLLEKKKTHGDYQSQLTNRISQNCDMKTRTGT